MRIAMIALGTRGDVQPYLALGDRAKDLVFGDRIANILRSRSNGKEWGTIVLN